MQSFDNAAAIAKAPRIVTDPQLKSLLTDRVPRMQWLLSLFAAPGRMALTNYLATSFAGVLLFYGIGFGLIGRLSPPQIYGVAVAIYAVQAMASHWWLARYSQGPMEAIWRRLTYGGIRRHDGDLVTP